MNILIPYDFSQIGDEALLYGMKLAHTTQSTCTVMHVLADIVSINEMPLYIIDNDLEVKLSKDLAAKIDTLKYPEIAALQVDNKIVHGMASVVIPIEAERGKYDLIVMGAHNKTDLFYRILGSTSATVLQSTSTPTLYIHQDNSLLWPIKKILFLIDEMADVKYAVEDIKKINSHLGAKIDFVHFDDGDTQDDENIDTILHEAFLGDQILGSFEIINLNSANVHATFTKYITENKYDLCVMIKRKVGFIKSLFQNSFTKDHINVGDMPLLVYKV
jgi:nucleotide-binding universal stress UspA family protein